MKQNLVIRNFIVFLLIISACSSSKQSINKETNKIINLEIERNTYSYQNQNKITLDFVLNNILISFFKEQVNGNSYSNALKKRIGDSLYEKMFNEKEINYFTEQLKIGKIDKSNISLPKDVVFNPNESKEKSAKDRLFESTKYRINLSIPIFTEDEKYSIISYSHGYENSMVGGISIYIKNGDDWKYHTSINEWIE